MATSNTPRPAFRHRFSPRAPVKANRPPTQSYYGFIRFSVLTISAVLSAYLSVLMGLHIPNLYQVPLFSNIDAILLGLTLFCVINIVFRYRPNHYWRKCGHLPAPFFGFIGGFFYLVLATTPATMYYTNEFPWWYFELFITKTNWSGITYWWLLLICLYVGSLYVSNAVKMLILLEHIPQSRSNDEVPIDSPLEDRYGYGDRARKWAKALHKGPLIIIGKYGSGKSSLANLIHLELDKAEQPIKVLKVAVGGWGLSTAESRIREVLKAIGDQLNQQIDTLYLRDYGENYIDSLLGKENFLARFFSFRQPSTIKMVGYLDRYLQISNQKIVLVLEDLERNQSGSSNENSPWHSGIEELIDQFRHSNRIYIITCVSEEAIK